MPLRNKIAAIFPFVLFGTHQLLQIFPWFHWPFAHAHVDPFCYLPILLTMWLLERHWLYGTNRLPEAFIAVATIVLSLIGEEVFPRLRADFIRDWWDYPFYFFGGLYFWLFVNPPSALNP